MHATRHIGSRRRTTGASGPAHHQVNIRAFSLLELLVVVATLSLLTALAIYSLRAAKSGSRDLHDLSNMRLTMVDFAAWSADHDATMPNAGPPGSQGSAWFYREQPAHVAEGLYRSQTTAWPRVLHHWMGKAQEYWQSPDGMNDPRGLLVNVTLAGPEFAPTHYLYSYTMLIEPGAWTFPGAALTPETLPERYRYIGTSQITHPGAKGVLLFLHRESLGAWLVAFADGSSRACDPAAATPAAAPPFGPPGARGRAVLPTLDGCRGVDF